MIKSHLFFSIKTKTGALVYDPLAISEEFQYSFQQLYSCDLRVTHFDSESLFDGLNLLQLSKKGTNSLDSPTTLNELYDTLKEMNRGRPPGLDGVPLELYLTSWEEFGSLLFQQLSIRDGGFHRKHNFYYNNK